MNALRKWLAALAMKGIPDIDQDRVRLLHPACIELSRFAQLTAEPKVCISVLSNTPKYRGGMTLMTFKQADAGDAKAEMYGKQIAEAFSVPLVDRREPA